MLEFTHLCSGARATVLPLAPREPLKQFLTSAAVMSVVLCSHSARAEGIVPLVNVGVAAEAHVPTQSNGQIHYSGSDFTSTTQMSQNPDRQFVLSAFVEHPIPVIPNVALRYTPVQLTTTSNVIANSSSGFRTGVANSELNLDQLDATLYYKLGLPITDVLTVKLGATAKVFTGNIKTSQVNGSSSVSDSKSLTIPIPMAYLGAHVNIPRTSLGLSADAHFVSYGDNKVNDVTLKAEYRFSKIPGLKVNAGYRTVNFKIDDISDVSADVKLDTAFIGLGFVF